MTRAGQSGHSWACKNCGHHTMVGFSTANPKCGQCGRKLTVFTPEDNKKYWRKYGKKLYGQWGKVKVNSKKRRK